MNCSGCAMTVFPDDVVCPNCGSAIERAEVRPRPPAPAPQADGSAALAVAPEESAATAAGGDPLPEHACPKHESMPVAGTCARCGNFYCVRCLPPGHDVFSKQCGDCVRLAAAEQEKDLVGIRGWLILPAIHLVVMTVGAAVSAAGIAYLRFGRRGRIKDEIVVLLVVLVATLVLGLVTSFFFFLKKRQAPPLMIALYLTNMLVAVVASDGDAMALGRAAGSICLWVPYFLVSKRVKATFTR